MTRWLALLVGGAIAVAGCTSGEQASRGSVEIVNVTVAGAADHEFVIPPGSAARANAGEHLTIFPSRLEVQVGETIRIVNQDDRVQIVGPFAVAPGQTLTQRFSTPGEFVGECTTHPDSEFVLVVRP